MYPAVVVMSSPTLVRVVEVVWGISEANQFLIGTSEEQSKIKFKP